MSRTYLGRATLFLPESLFFSRVASEMDKKITILGSEADRLSLTQLWARGPHDPQGSPLSQGAGLN